jgi:transcriptional regulator with XRE-family HTH domain
VGAFGEKLRQRREQRGLTIEAISNTTKISPRMLLALEEERFDQLPGGVFNKGFVRAYARQLGLSEEETLNDYLAALRETQVQSQQILPDFRKPGHAAPIPASETASHAPLRAAAVDPVNDVDDSESHSNSGTRFLDDLSDRRRSERRRADRRDASHRNAEQPKAVPHTGFSEPTFAAASAHREISVEDSAPAPAISRRRKLGAAILLISAGLGGWIRHRHHESPAPPPAAAHSTPAAVTTTSTTPPTSAHTPPPAPIAPSAIVPPKITAHSAAHAAAPAATEKSELTPPKPSPSPASPSLASRPASAVAPPSSVPAHQLAAKAPATFTLTIRADKTTWVSISSDGNPVARETLIAPAHTSVRATSQIVVRAGNAAGVSFLLNGKEIPATGNTGEVRTYTFNSTGLASNTPAIPSTNR